MSFGLYNRNINALLQLYERNMLPKKNKGGKQV